MKLKRFENNPIISPTANWWESQATFNPGVTVFNDQIILLYRAIGEDKLSRFGLAFSNDGKVFERFSDSILEGDPLNPYERLGIEDPRITKMGDTYYIVYTAVSLYDPGSGKNDLPPSSLRPANWRIRPSLITTKDFKNFERKGILLEQGTKDGVLFPEKINGKFALLHRIYPHVYLNYSVDLTRWSKEMIIFSPRKDFWDSERVGVGGVPIKTEKGWLLFYHGVDPQHVWQIGWLLLNLNDPTKVNYRSKQPILEPVEDYERVGLTPNAVFTCGVIERGDKYFVYYGAADKVIGLATIDKNELTF